MLDRFHKPPFARHLPARQLLEQELFQFLLDAVPVRRDARHDVIHPVRVPARHAKDEAFVNGLVFPQRLFDDVRANFSPGHVDVVAGAAAQTNHRRP